MTQLAQRLNPLRRTAFIVGGVALLAAVVVALFGGAERFFQSYLFAFWFWLGLSLGSLVMLFVVHLAGGSWGALIRRPLEAAAMVLPLLGVLFIPLLFGLGTLFEWTHAEFVAALPTVAAKTAYLNVPFFIVRAVIYFAVWITGAWLFFRASGRQDEVSPEEGGRIGFRLKRISGAWIVIYVLTMTFAGIDWAMSLNPEFFSGIYSVILMIGQAISAVCLSVFAVVWLASWNAEVNERLTAKRLQDLGNFLMAFTMFWAYTNFAQLIIIWSNNTVETNPSYVLRFSEAWQGLGLFLLFFGFFAPFAVLFSRWVKRKRRALVWVAAWSLLIRLVDLFYIVVPGFRREGFPLGWLDVLLLIGIGGLWLGAFAFFLGSRPALPHHEPRLGHAPTPAHAKAVEHHA